MISTAEFKKQIGKYLGNSIREQGFKGSGFNYIKDSDYFVYTIGIQPSQYGGKFCAEFGIQPKSVITNGFNTHNFKKIKYNECEFRTRITSNGRGDKWWDYNIDESKNFKLVDEVIELIKEIILPIIEKFEDNPSIFDIVEVSDLKNVHLNFQKKLGFNVSSTDVRLSWVFMKHYEKSNLNRAIEFAKFGLSRLDDDNLFFGKEEIKNFISVND